MLFEGFSYAAFLHPPLFCFSICVSPYRQFQISFVGQQSEKIQNSPRKLVHVRSGHCTFFFWEIVPENKPINKHSLVYCYAWTHATWQTSICPTCKQTGLFKLTGSCLNHGKLPCRSLYGWLQYIVQEPHFCVCFWQNNLFEIKVYVKSWKRFTQLALIYTDMLDWNESWGQEVTQHSKMWIRVLDSVWKNAGFYFLPLIDNAFQELCRYFIFRCSLFPVRLPNIRDHVSDPAFSHFGLLSFFLFVWRMSLQKICNRNTFFNLESLKAF